MDLFFSPFEAQFVQFHKRSYSLCNYWKWTRGVFSDSVILSWQLISLEQSETEPLNDLNSVMLILAHTANIQGVLNCDFFFFFRPSVVVLIVPRGQTPSLQDSTLFTFHQCQNTKSPSKLVFPQPNGSQTLFHRRFRCSALCFVFGGVRTRNCDVNRGHVQMQLTLAARCFVLSSHVILFDPHVEERLLATCDQRLWILKSWYVVPEQQCRTFDFSSTSSIF